MTVANKLKRKRQEYAKLEDDLGNKEKKKEGYENAVGFIICLTVMGKCTPF